MIYHIEKPDSFISQLIGIAFPSYSGRKIKLSTDIPDHLDSFWNGGSKNSFCFISSDFKKFSVPNNHPFYDNSNYRKLSTLPKNVFLIMHSIFCGKDSGITIFCNSEMISGLIPKTVSISNDEKIVLKFTDASVNTYAGITNLRFKNANRCNGISEMEWNIAKSSLISQKMLRKNGSITCAGKNQLRTI